MVGVETVVAVPIARAQAQALGQLTSVPWEQRERESSQKGMAGKHDPKS